MVGKRPNNVVFDKRAAAILMFNPKFMEGIKPSLFIAGDTVKADIYSVNLSEVITLCDALKHGSDAQVTRIDLSKELKECRCSDHSVIFCPVHGTVLVPGNQD